MKLKLILSSLIVVCSLCSFASAAVRVVGLGGGGSEMRALNVDLDSYLDWALERPEVWGLDTHNLSRLQEIVGVDSLVRLGLTPRPSEVVFVDAYEGVGFSPSRLVVLRSDLPQEEAGALSQQMRVLFRARIANFFWQVEPVLDRQFRRLEDPLFDGLERFDRSQIQLESGSTVVWSLLKLREKSAWLLQAQLGDKEPVDLLQNILKAIEEISGDAELIDLDPPRVEGQVLTLKASWRSNEKLFSAILTTDAARLLGDSTFQAHQVIQTNQSCQGWVESRSGKDGDLF